MPLDWRGTLTTEEPSRRVETLAAELDARFDDAEVSSRGKRLLIYADAGARVREIGHEAQRALPVKAIRLERWNPGRLVWQDPALPLEEPPPLEQAPDLRHARWEVFVTTPDRRGERELGDRLRAEGFAVAQGLWETRLLIPTNKRLAVAIADGDEAERLAERLRIEAPVGSKIRVRRLSFFRRWLIGQELYGSYADGGGGYGDGGGGDG